MEQIKSIQQKWVQAKLAAQEQSVALGNLSLAQKLADCKMFKGTEDLGELAELMFTPQGIEFMIQYNFPDLATFRKFKKYHPERFNVYIDCGKIVLNEPNRAFLVGNTFASVQCSEKITCIVLMHGARAYINASGYSLVKIDCDAESEVIYNKRDHARILR